MIKKIALKAGLASLFLISSSLLQGIESTIEVRSGVFYHTNKHFRRNYGDAGPFFEIEGSVSCNPCCYAFWGNLDWFKKRDHAYGNTCSSVIKDCDCSGHPSTTVNIGNISFGIKFPYEFCPGFIGYVGIGPSFGVIWLKNHQFHHRTRTSKFAFGGVLKTGVNTYITNCVFLDFFVDYLYQPVHFKHQKHIDIGGVKAGIGLGMTF